MAGHFRVPYSELMEWDDYDLALAREWWRRREMTCQSCGTRREEWIPSQGGHPRAYHADVSQCPGCVVVERKRDEISKDKEWEADRALRIVLRPTSSG